MNLLEMKHDRLDRKNSQLQMAPNTFGSLLLCRRTGREITTSTSVLRKPGPEAAAGAGGDAETAAGS